MAREHRLYCAAVGTSLGGEIGHKFAIGGNSCAATARKSALGGKVGVGGDKATVKCVATNKLNKKALTATVSADKESAGRASLCYGIEIVEQRADLLSSADSDIGRAHARHDSCRKRR